MKLSARQNRFIRRNSLILLGISLSPSSGKTCGDLTSLRRLWEDLVMILLADGLNAGADLIGHEFLAGFGHTKRVTPSLCGRTI
jgi:hypothetical protein